MSLSELTIEDILKGSAEVVLENGRIVSVKWGGNNE